VLLGFVVGFGYSALRAGLSVRCECPRVRCVARERAFNRIIGVFFVAFVFVLCEIKKDGSFLLDGIKNCELEGVLGPVSFPLLIEQ
jgi:hypothetical protein